MPRTVAWWSESGGPGKTTNSMNSAAAIGRDGYDVLVFDLDPQRGSVTHYAGFDELQTDDEDAGGPVDTHIVDVMFDGADIHDVIVEAEHFDLVPGHEDLGNFASELDSAGLRGVDEYFVVREIVEGLKDEYDYFIFDLPATLNELTDNGLVAARNVMVPLELSPKGSASLDGLEDTVEAMDSGFGKMGVNIRIMGNVPSRVGNAKLFEDIRDELTDDGVPVSPFSIPEHSLLRYTWRENMDLFQFIESSETRDLRSYEEHVPLAYKVIGRWMTGDLSYQEAIEKWDQVKDQEMGDAEPEMLLDEEPGVPA